MHMIAIENTSSRMEGETFLRLLWVVVTPGARRSNCACNRGRLYASGRGASDEASVLMPCRSIFPVPSSGNASVRKK